MGNIILLADKSITIQKIVELTFSDDEYEIRCVNDGQSALEAIPQIRPDLILADISLPVRSGYEICEILRTNPEYASFAQTPVILLAGIYETMDEERARAVEEKVREVGANDLLSKPFDPQLLTTKVKDLMNVFNPPPAQSKEEAVSKTQDIFAESLHPEEDTITGSLQEMGGESYDAEKTMMLPGPPMYSTNMFAEAPPFDSGDADLEQETVNIGSVTPLNEPIFEEADLQALPPSSEQSEDAAPSMDFNEPSFGTREDQEFSFDNSEETLINRDAFFVPQANEPMFDASEESQRTVPQPSMIIPEADDPFGDVFGESPDTTQWNASASEEDSPFGLPEPPPPPPAPPVEEVQEALAPVVDVESTGPLTIPPELLWSAQKIETPQVEEHVGEAFEEPKEEIEEIDSSAEVKASFGENTWARERSLAGERTAEELFDSEAASDTVPAVEEAEELQPDLSETTSTQQMSSEPMPEVPQVSSAVPASPPEITEELINRIADRIVGKLSERIVTEIVWQVVPDLAEKMIRRELEKLHAGEE